MQKLKVNDEIIVTAGKDKGKSGKVRSVNFKNNRVLVEGLNLVKKTIKPTQENPNGGIVSKELPLHISNIAIKSPKTGKPSRVKIVTGDDGKKVRVLVACGTELK